VKRVTPDAHDGWMDLLMNVVASVAGLLMVVVGGYAIAAIWWDDLT
jgi:hypothetical protein